jgi:hypothetical protein
MRCIFKEKVNLCCKVQELSLATCMCTLHAYLYYMYTFMSCMHIYVCAVVHTVHVHVHFVKGPLTYIQCTSYMWHIKLHMLYMYVCMYTVCTYMYVCGWYAYYAYIPCMHMHTFGVHDMYVLHTCT